MATYSFKLEANDFQGIKDQLGRVGLLKKQIDELAVQMRHELDFASMAWRAALAEAKMSGSLAKTIEAVPLVNQTGSLVPRIDESGVATWEVMEKPVVVENKS